MSIYIVGNWNACRQLKKSKILTPISVIPVNHQTVNITVVLLQLSLVLVILVQSVLICVICCRSVVIFQYCMKYVAFEAHWYKLSRIIIVLSELSLYASNTQGM